MAPQFTGDHLLKVLNTLEKPQAMTLVRTVLGANTRDRFAHMGSLDLLRGGIWEFLLAVNFVSEVQATLVVHRMVASLTDLARVLDAGGKTLPVYRLTIAEKRWVTWPTSPTWFDFYTQEAVAALPEPPVLLVTCDVTALYLRLVQRLERVRSKDAKQSEPGASGDGAA